MNRAQGRWVGGGLLLLAAILHFGLFRWGWGGRNTAVCWVVAAGDGAEHVVLGEECVWGAHYRFVRGLWSRTGPGLDFGLGLVVPVMLLPLAVGRFVRRDRPDPKWYALRPWPRSKAGWLMVCAGLIPAWLVTSRNNRANPLEMEWLGGAVCLYVCVLVLEALLYLIASRVPDEEEHAAGPEARRAQTQGAPHLIEVKTEVRSRRMSMNGAQKAVFACGLIVAVLMGLFPPWVERVDRLPGGESPGVRIARPIGYGSLFSPPEAPSSQNTELAGWYRRMYYVTVDLKRLFVQEGIVIVATAGVMLLLKGGGGSEPISAERKG